MAMNVRRIETLVWVLLYGGIVGASVGWFVTDEDVALGLGLQIVGGVAAAVGALLIWVRSRHPDAPVAPKGAKR
jgi:hypothetical protein